MAEPRVPFWVRYEPERPCDPDRERDPDRRCRLGVDVMVRTALRIADTEGEPAVSMRRLAADLGVGTMSLYRHVQTKDDLIDLMLDEVLAEIDIPARPPGDWRADLRDFAMRYREVLLRHPWMLPLVASRPPIGPNALRNTEYALAVLEPLDIGIAAMAAIWDLVTAYVRGAVLTELCDAQAQRRTGLSDEEWRQAVAPYITRMLATGRFPLVARYIDEAEEHPDGTAVFENGLDQVLDGLAAGLRRTPG